MLGGTVRPSEDIATILSNAHKSSAGIRKLYGIEQSAAAD